MVTRSLARDPQATVTGVYERTGGIVKFNVTVTNNTGQALSIANKAAVHAIIYEDNNAHKTNRIGRASAKADISYLANGKTETFFIELTANGVVDWSKAHFLVLVDYKLPETKDFGKYDQPQAAIASPGTVTQPTLFKLDPKNFPFEIYDRATELPTGELTVTLPTDKTWTASTDVQWLSVEQETGGNGDVVNFEVTTKEHFAYGKNYGMVILTESGSGRQRAAIIEVDYSKAPVPEFKVLPVSITKTIQHSDPPGPEVGVRISGDKGQTWTAESEEDWIIMTPPNGSVPATFIVTFDRSKLKEGLNEGKIIVRDGDDFHEKTVTVKVTYIGGGEEPPLENLIYFPLVITNAE
jgi:hypothetical protein